MSVMLAPGNYRNDSLLLGFSDLRKLRTERPLVITHGRGISVIDENGKDYIEAVSAFYCVALGFSDEELIEAAVRQLRTLPIYISAVHRTVPVVMELAERLAAISPMPGTRVAFATTGSEVNDHLIKFMWYGNGFAGQPQRRKLVSRWGSYHGSTIATAALGGGSDLHTSFAIPQDEVLFISHPTWPGGAEPGESEAAYGDRLAAELRDVIERAGPETVGALIAEPVSVSSGMHPPPAGYFTKLEAVVRELGVQLFIDEVVTGFGRTGTMWATEALGVVPDCMTSAKGLTSAYQPLAALMMGEGYAGRLERGSDVKGWLAHGGTYHAHPVGAAVACKVLDLFEKRDILGHVRRVIPLWHAALDRLGGHPLVAGVRKHGLMGALELADPRGVAEAGGVATTLKIGGLTNAVYEAGLEAGVIVRPLSSCIVMAPPLVITGPEIDELAERLKTALDAVLAQPRRA